MNILMSLFRCFPSGGVQRDALAIAAAALERGHRVTMMTTEWCDLPPPAERFSLALVEGAGGSNHRRLFNFSRQVQAHAPGYDRCLGFSPGPGLGAFFAANGCLARRTAERPAWLGRLPRYRTLLGLEREALAAPQVLFLCEAQQRGYAEHYDISAAHLLPPALQADAVAAVEAAPELTLPPHRWLVLQVGASVDTKGLDRSLETVAHLPEPLREQVLLLMVGGVHPQLARRARRLGVRLHMSQPLECLSGVYHRAHLMLHPARREAGGKVLLEAMAHGLPVLASATCGYAGLVADAGAGAVIPEPFAGEAAAGQLAQMLQDDGQRAQMRQAGLAWHQRQVPGAFERTVMDVVEQA